MILGRTDCESEDSNSSSHVWISNIHNTSENPTVGRSGRFPLRTFCMTAASRLVFPKGLRPVTTYKGKARLRDRSSRSGELMRTSRMVIPSAYMSVLFDGNFLRARLTYPYLSGSIISGAIHRIVPSASRLLGSSTKFASPIIAVSPKSAKQARHSELIRMLVCVSNVTG